MQVELTVNGVPHRLDVSERTLLVHALRDHLRLTGAHIGCDTSQCGACTVHLDGVAVKSCAVLAVQADGATVVTVEGLADGQTLHPMQEAFSAYHALQCGYCTPGMIMAGIDIVRRHGVPDADTIKAELVGNLCRCTGYHNIVCAIAAGAQAMAASR
jgi:carbon-monoxide dehydrogenase small subunit